MLALQPAAALQRPQLSATVCRPQATRLRAACTRLPRSHRALLRCRAEAQPGPDSQSAAGAAPAAAPEAGNPGAAVAGASAAVGTALFLLTRVLGGPSLSSLEAQAVPLDQALANGRPTVVEFYADWCEVCRETAPTVFEVEKQYQGRVNFVMLNVDNTKWVSEMRDFGVDGIPHFAFLDTAGRSQGQVIGRLPREVLEGDLNALVAGESLPYARYTGATSGVNAPDVKTGSSSKDPRAHS